MKRPRVWIALAAVLAASGAVLAVRTLGSSGGEVPLFEVKKGVFGRRVIAEGNLKAVKATPVVTPGSDMTFKIAWLADDGSQVKKGDVLVRFDPTETEKNLALGRGERLTADKRILKERSESGATLSNLSRDAAQYREELEAARTFQSKDPELFSRHEILQADIDVDLAGHREQNARSVRTVREGLARTNIDLLGIERRKADLKLDKAEKERSSLEILAPHDGLVVFVRDWRGELPQIGQSVWSGFPIGELPDLSKMEAEVWVLEADAGGLAVGESATVAVESAPLAGVPATIRRVDALPKPRMRGVPVQYFGATLELSKTDRASMKPGQRVRANLRLGDEKEALSVPRQSIFDKDGKKIVYRRRGKTFEAVEVTLGASALGRVVVDKGLKEGDRLALRDPTERPAATPRAASASVLSP